MKKTNHQIESMKRLTKPMLRFIDKKILGNTYQWLDLIDLHQNEIAAITKSLHRQCKCVRAQRWGPSKASLNTQ